MLDKIDHTLPHAVKDVKTGSKESWEQVNSANLAEDGAGISEETLIVSKRLLDKNDTVYKMLAE